MQTNNAAPKQGILCACGSSMSIYFYDLRVRIIHGMLAAFSSIFPIREINMSKQKERLSLHERTVELLHTRPANMKIVEIAAATGITVAWLRAFARQDFDDPSVNKTQRLYEFLSNKKLKV